MVKMADVVDVKVHVGILYEDFHVQDAFARAEPI